MTSDNGASVDNDNKRAFCPRCQRAQKVCLCAHIVERKTPFELIIWQDPTEAKHKLSTTPLLHASIANSRLIVADQLTFADVFGENEKSNTESCALLYPLEHKPALTTEAYGRINKLLVLDGTWRKVRRLLHLNPWLNELNHIALDTLAEGGWQSNYRIRKSPRADGVSTLEAAVMACKQLDDKQDYQPVLSVLEAMVSQQEAFTKQRKQR